LGRAPSGGESPVHYLSYSSVQPKRRQMLPAPNTFEPAPNIISKIPKIPFILEMKIQN